MQDNAVADVLTGVIFLIGGAYMMFVAPKQVHRKLRRGDLIWPQGRIVVEKYPLFGLGLLALAVSKAILALIEKNFFGFGVLFYVVSALFAVAMIMFVVWFHRRLDD